MTPAQRAAARTAHTEAVRDLQHDAEYVRDRDYEDDPQDGPSVTAYAARFVRHTEVLAGHLALALQPDPFDGLAGNPAAVGASEPPPSLHPTEGPTP